MKESKKIPLTESLRKPGFFRTQYGGYYLAILDITPGGERGTDVIWPCGTRQRFDWLPQAEKALEQAGYKDMGSNTYYK